METTQEQSPQNLPNRYFVKEIVSNPLWSTKGYRIPFDDMGDDIGLLITSHPGLIQELETCIKTRRGGVYEIQAHEVEELKKKAVSDQILKNSLLNDSLQRLRLETTLPFQNRTPSREAAAAAKATSLKAALHDPNAAEVPVQPLDPVPTIDPALLRPKPKKKSALSSSSQPPPQVTPTVLPQ